MKSFLAIVIGIGMLATAGATVVSTQVVATSIDPTNHLTLTTEQTKVLQTKYRNWSSSHQVALKAPI